MARIKAGIASNAMIIRTHDCRCSAMPSPDLSRSPAYYQPPPCQLGSGTDAPDRRAPWDPVCWPGCCAICSGQGLYGAAVREPYDALGLRRCRKAPTLQHPSLRCILLYATGYHPSTIFGGRITYIPMHRGFGYLCGMDWAVAECCVAAVIH